MTEFEITMNKCKLYLQYILKECTNVNVQNCEYKERGLICFNKQDDNYLYFIDYKEIIMDIPKDICTEEGYFQYSTLLDSTELFSSFLMRYLQLNCKIQFSVPEHLCYQYFIKHGDINVISK